MQCTRPGSRVTSTPRVSFRGRIRRGPGLCLKPPVLRLSARPGIGCSMCHGVMDVKKVLAGSLP